MERINSKYKHIAVTDYEIEYTEIGTVCNRDEPFLAGLLARWFSEHRVRVISADRYAGYGTLGYHIFYEDLDETPLLSDSLQTDTEKE